MCPSNHSFFFRNAPHLQSIRIIKFLVTLKQLTRPYICCIYIIDDDPLLYKDVSSWGFGMFYHKKRNAEFCQYLVPQKPNFYRQRRLLKKLYKICADDYDNNEYLAVKCIRLFTNDII